MEQRSCEGSRRRSEGWGWSRQGRGRAVPVLCCPAQPIHLPLYRDSSKNPHAPSPRAIRHGCSKRALLWAQLLWCPEASPESNSRTDFLPKSSHSWAVSQHLGSSPDLERIFLLVCCRSLLVLSFPLSSCVIICMFTIFCRSYLWVGTKPRDLQGRDSPACHQTSEAAP